MAKMIPPHLHRNTPSGERLTFERLRDDPATNDWTVLHSLYLSQHGFRPYGEVDFVVFIPHQGIFCLEVKSGTVEQHNGVWKTTGADRITSTLKRSPFAQARDEMFAIRERVLREPISGADLAVIAFGNAVVLPHTQFTITSEEWEPWEVIDITDFQQPISVAILRLAREQRRRLNTPPAAMEPTASTIRALVHALRPDFETVIARGTTIAESERAIRQLTEEQYDLLFNLPAHPRWICEGAAGTGKTMLALEYAIRLAETTDERVLLVCYNHLLGDWLEREVKARGLSDRIKSGTFHRVLKAVIVKSSLATPFAAAERTTSGSDLFNRVYPEFGWQAVEEIGEKFDTVIVDEAQDLVRPEFLDVIDCWVAGTLKTGQAVFFADFHRQAIYSDLSAEQQRNLLDARLPGRAPWALRLNCRNTKVIAEETALLSGFEVLPYRLSAEAGAPVDYARYRDDAHQAELLVERITKLLQDGVRDSDIVIVSPRKLQNSAVQLLLKPECTFRVIEAGAETPKLSRKPIIRFSTAHSFKGMESPVVVLCDIDTLGDGEPQSILYIAMSRARSQLTVLRHECTQPAYIGCVNRALSSTWNKQR